MYERFPLLLTIKYSYFRKIIACEATKELVGWVYHLTVKKAIFPILTSYSMSLQQAGIILL